MTCNSETKLDNYNLGTIIIGGPEGKIAFHKKDNDKWYGTRATYGNFSGYDSWEYITRHPFSVVVIGDKPCLPTEPPIGTIVKIGIGGIYQRKSYGWFGIESTVKHLWETIARYEPKVIYTP